MEPSKRQLVCIFGLCYDVFDGSTLPLAYALSAVHAPSFYLQSRLDWKFRDYYFWGNCWDNFHSSPDVSRRYPAHSVFLFRGYLNYAAGQLRDYSSCATAVA